MQKIFSHIRFWEFDTIKYYESAEKPKSISLLGIGFGIVAIANQIFFVYRPRPLPVSCKGINVFNAKE